MPAVSLVIALVGALQASGPASGQILEPAVVFRVFLNDGHVLPTYGEFAVAGDRLVFVLPVGDPLSRVELQLMSVPLSSVDMFRTSQYAAGMRARDYARTRGPAEYSAIAADVSLALAELEKEKDTTRRLTLAESARSRLLAWSNEHYGYRASEIHELAGLFDDAIAEIGGASGAPKFSVNMTAGPGVPSFEPELPLPNVGESIWLALSAVKAADVAADRSAILRTALAVATAVPGLGDLRAMVSRILREELVVDAAYAQLTSELVARAATAARLGDVRGAEAIVLQMETRDRALGGRQPKDMQTLRTRLVAAVELAREHRTAQDHWAVVVRTFYDYELQVRPILSSLDGLSPVLAYIRDSKYMAVERVVRADAVFVRLKATLDQIVPPEELRNVHSTLLSAVSMAHLAGMRRRQIDVAPNPSAGREAAAAAAGTLLLAAQARQDLLAHLFPPRFQ
jgi:hypothetical protein